MFKLLGDASRLRGVVKRSSTTPLRSKRKNSQIRRGVLTTSHGKIQTPFFMPIATRGAVKGVSSQELEELGAEIILSNTYHLMLRPGEKMIKKAKIIPSVIPSDEPQRGVEPACSPRSGGEAGRRGRGSHTKNLTNLHAFMNWPRPILTDSGGFQVFSLAKSRKITEKGAEFRSDIDGKKYLLTPEKSIEVQFALGSDIIMVLDECVTYPASYEYVKKSVELTTRWAKRCKDFYLKAKSYKLKALFGIVQGGIYKDLRRKSAQDLIKIGFDGYAIGGLAVGEPKEKMWEMVKFVNKILPKNKPRYLMGAGMPEDIVRAISLGCDMFDCVIPTRNARHGHIFKFEARNPCLALPRRRTGGRRAKSETNSKSQISNPKFYEIIRINNSEYKNKFQPIDKNCPCFTCQNYSLAYLHHLFKSGDFLGQRLATIHNIKFYLELMEILRARV